MPTRRLTLLSRRQTNTSSQLLLWLIAFGACSSLLARAGQLELDLNELAPGEEEEEQQEESLAVHDDDRKAAGRQETEGPGEGESWSEKAQKWRSRVSNTISAAKNKLPDYFDFEHFRNQFKRKYAPAEFFYRKSVFLGKCLQVLKSRVAYRLGVSHHLETVNKFSDRSAPEMRRMFMSGPPAEFKAAEQSESDYYKQVEREFLKREREAEQAEQAELVSKASAFETDQSADQIQSADDWLSAASAPGDRQTVFHEEQVRNQLKRILALADDEQLRAALREELDGSALETYSQAASCANCASTTLNKALPWPGRQRSGSSSSQLPDLNLSDANYLSQPEAADIGDERLDWSEHECFHQIYDQGDKCGKCYVMASTTLAEFYKCSETINVIDKRKFSKEFVLDCGQKYSPTLMGCQGGSILDTLRFIALAGAHNIRGWRERYQSELASARQSGAFLSGLDLKCPLDRLSTPLNEWGAIQVEMNPRAVPLAGWLEALQDGPLVASVQMPPQGLDSYQSGVHDGAGCQGSGLWHSMVLVGYGRGAAGGPAYWRFRNSWGANWGEQGHFNLAMSVPSECLAGAVRVYREPLDFGERAR